MARDRVRVVVLCEDREQSSFLRRLFTHLGVQPLRFEVAPFGAGSAEQWVRLRLSAEVKAHRSQAPHQANLALVVMTDGDRFGLRSRCDSFDKVLAEDGQEARQPAERILYLVPTWSIETWLAWLCDVAAELGGIDERTAYKEEPAFGRLVAAGQISARTAVQRWTPPQATENATVPSLTAARAEVAKLPR